MRHKLLTALVAVLVLLAGCSAGPAGDTAETTLDGADRTTTAGDTAGSDGTSTADGSTTDGSTADGSTTDGSTADGSTDGESTDESVQFYLSDRPNVISDFDHLNVTVTKVGIHRAGNDSAGGEWLEYGVNATVDLTRLQGANASKIGSFDLSNGSYTKVFVYVSDTHGVMNGTDKRVKLPSGKLQLNKGFTVGQGEPLDFVFDIAVHKAGKSGKYILSPVVAESGTGDEVEIRDVDADEAETDENEAEENGADEADENEAEENGADEADENEADENGADGESVTTATSTETATATATPTSTPTTTTETATPAA